MTTETEAIVVTVGDADKEYVHALNQLMNTPNGSFAFKSAVKRIARELEAAVMLKTGTLRKDMRDLQAARSKAQRAERQGKQLTEKEVDALIKQEEVLESGRETVYAEEITLKSVKIPKSSIPSDDDLMKTFFYQVMNPATGGQEGKQTDYMTQLVIVYDVFVDEQA
jgi:hypothetical protein